MEAHIHGLQVDLMVKEVQLLIIILIVVKKFFSTFTEIYYLIFLGGSSG